MAGFGYVEIDRQLRYGRFSGGDKLNFSETFLRGVRIIAKTKSSGDEKPNYNANKLSYIKDGAFNDYKFSCMVVINEPGKPENEIKFIKNDKWKTVVMLIFTTFDEGCINFSNREVDRTSLYSLSSSITTTACAPTPFYENSIMQGAISFTASGYVPTVNQYLIKGIPDINGVPTDFVNDITIGSNGQYNPIEFTIGGDTYKIDGISRILSKSELYAGTITKNTLPITLPSPTPSKSKF